MQAGDPGCVYNQHVWDEVVRDAEKQDELAVLGQHDPVESLLTGARGGTVTTRVDRLVRDSLIQIADVIDPNRRVQRRLSGESVSKLVVVFGLGNRSIMRTARRVRTATLPDEAKIASQVYDDSAGYTDAF